MPNKVWDEITYPFPNFSILGLDKFSFLYCFTQIIEVVMFVWKLQTDHSAWNSCNNVVELVCCYGDTFSPWASGVGRYHLGWIILTVISG